MIYYSSFQNFCGAKYKSGQALTLCFIYYNSRSLESLLGKNNQYSARQQFADYLVKLALKKFLRTLWGLQNVDHFEKLALKKFLRHSGGRQIVEICSEKILSHSGQVAICMWLAPQLYVISMWQYFETSELGGLIFFKSMFYVKNSGVNICGPFWEVSSEKIFRSLDGITKMWNLP